MYIRMAFSSWSMCMQLLWQSDISPEAIQLNEMSSVSLLCTFHFILIIKSKAKKAMVYLMRNLVQIFCQIISCQMKSNSGWIGCSFGWCLYAQVLLHGSKITLFWNSQWNWLTADFWHLTAVNCKWLLMYHYKWTATKSNQTNNKKKKHHSRFYCWDLKRQLLFSLLMALTKGG